SAATLLTTAQFTTTLSGQVDWQDRSPNARARTGPALAFDMQRGRTGLFGGAWGPPPPMLTDTCEWGGTSWAPRGPANPPSARDGHALAYDLARGRTVLFGGVISSVLSSVLLADTWEWDGVNWTQRFPAQSPPARAGHALASDVIRNRTVLFGGASFNG